ncbi:hypothetical protein ABBQ32_006985 [Trebouxia sp. C0010 RCD-2024]
MASVFVLPDVVRHTGCCLTRRRVQCALKEMVVAALVVATYFGLCCISSLFGALYRQLLNVETAATSINQPQYNGLLAWLQSAVAECLHTACASTSSYAFSSRQRMTNGDGKCG